MPQTGHRHGLESTGGFSRNRLRQCVAGWRFDLGYVVRAGVGYEHGAHHRKERRSGGISRHEYPFSIRFAVAFRPFYRRLLKFLTLATRFCRAPFWLHFRWKNLVIFSSGDIFQPDAIVGFTPLSMLS